MIALLLVIFFLWPHVCQPAFAVDIQLFTMQKNSEYLHDWVRYHGNIVGYNNLTIIDTDSNAQCKQHLRRLQSIGVNVVFRSALAFRDKKSVMTTAMKNKVRQGESFLVPLDIDEFLVAVRYGGDRYTTFSLHKAVILDMFRALPRPTTQSRGMKYKLNTFDAVDCNVAIDTHQPPQPKKHHSLNSFVEDKESYARCNAKTFYHSLGFSYTDDGNHHGEVRNQSSYCFTKHRCKKCYQRFMRSGLGLIHYSAHAMTYNEVKSKMLDRFAVLPHFQNVTAVENCSLYQKNTHYCKFRAHLLTRGDGYLMDKLRAKRQKKCSEGLFRTSAPVILFSSYHGDVGTE